MAGWAASANAIATAGAHQNTHGGGTFDAFLAKFDDSGIRQWGTYYGGSEEDHGLSCAIDTNGKVFMTGHTRSTNSIASSGSHQDTYGGGNWDAFLVKFGPCVTSDTINPLVCDTTYTSSSGTYVWDSTGTYMDTISNQSGCDSILTINLTIDSSSSATLAPPATCDSYTSPSGNYTWTASGTYMDTIANQAGCDSVLTINLSIDSSSTATLAPSVCDASYTSPSGSYTWSSSGAYMDTLPNAVGCDSVLTINLTIDNSTARTLAPLICDTTYASPSGNYAWDSTGTYMDTIPNQAGCDSILTIDLTVTDELTANAWSDTSICEGESVQLDATGGSAYVWQPAVGLSCTNCPAPTASPPDTTTYMVIASGGLNCEPDTAYVTVEVIPSPGLFIEPGDTSIAGGEEVHLNASGGTSYVWTPAEGLSCTACPDPVAAPAATTVYTLHYTDENGCSVIDSIQIIVLEEDAEPEKELFIPNSFSPNGDGINDQLLVYGDAENISSLYLVITNRWGEKVYETNSRDEAMGVGWDGTHRGKPLNTGVFVYYLEVTYYNGEEELLGGDITLIR